MSLWESLGLAALRQIDPETAHGLALKALTMGLVPLPGPVTSTRLACNLAGMPLLNPVGLAAGFDKNATAIAPLSRAGFGFIEVGAATPAPQPGNPRPRLFRLPADGALINRLGFNSPGMVAVARNLRSWELDAGSWMRNPQLPIIGVNIGKNRTTALERAPA